MKLITIAIPAYNMEKYLSRCLNSLLDKTIIDFIEIIIINDGSKDNTITIANDYKSKYSECIKVIDKENGGWGSGINAAIRNANGKYFKILDADDWFDSENFVTFISELSKLNVDLILTPYVLDFIHKGKKKKIQFKNVEYNNIYTKSSLGGLNWGHKWFELPTITYRTEILKKNNITISECFYSDIEYDYLPLKYINSFIFCNLEIYHYYIGREGQSVSPEGVTKHYNDHLYICKKLLSYYNNINNVSDLQYITILKRIVIEKTIQNYIALMKFYIDRKKYIPLLYEFDNYIKEYNLELYKEVGENCRLYGLKPIKLWRKFDYNIYRSFLYKVLLTIKNK